MGNEISAGSVTPLKTETVTTSSGTSSNGLEYGAAHMQGRREYMEDAHVIIDSLNSTSLKDTSLYAVFDGHGGSFCSRYAAEVILRVLQSTDDFVMYERLKTQSERDDPVDGLCLLIRALRNTFIAIDDELLAGDVTQGGSTAVVVVVTPSHIVSANAGDSRAVLGKKRNKKAGSNTDDEAKSDQRSFRHRATPLSFDHKPKSRKEAARIKKAGGFVRSGRVGGKLAVSRALGDFDFKMTSPQDPSNDIVTVLPEFVVVKRNDNVDEFIVLASDGIWDIVSNSKCGEMVYNSLRMKGSTPTAACNDLLEKCYNGGSKDNMTVIIVKMPGLLQNRLPSQNPGAISEQLIQRQRQVRVVHDFHQIEITTT